MNYYDQIQFPLLSSTLALLGCFFIVLSLFGYGATPTVPVLRGVKSRLMKVAPYGAVGYPLLLLSIFFAHHFSSNLAIAVQLTLALVTYLIICAACLLRKSEFGMLATQGIIGGLLLLCGVNYRFAIIIMLALMCLSRAAFWRQQRLAGRNAT